MPSPIIAVHLAVALLALAVGATVLIGPKGTARHKALGRSWVALMLVVAIGSFWIRTITPGGGLSPIHILSAWTVVSLAIAVWAIRTGHVRTHRGFMIGTFCGLAAAGVGAVAYPGRLLNQWLFGG